MTPVRERGEANGCPGSPRVGEYAYNFVYVLLGELTSSTQAIEQLRRFFPKKWNEINLP